ncbi:TPA: antibiotic biosynthesis monooxygenase [Enterobacter hormaechei subsp. steigerwaltii]|nr:antibiotic biosynthesis monooxygenase [Enterobacter hormaechei subsp. steigerwaltii]
MIVTVFRFRLSSVPDAQRAYAEMAPCIYNIAKSTPGFISFKRFDAEDGERVAIVEFDNLESHDRFVSHPEHRKAQMLGKSKAFVEYDIKVCEVFRVMGNKA